MRKPKDSMKEIEVERSTDVEEKEEPTKIISSSQAEHLMPCSRRTERGTLSILVKMRGAHERPKTRATKQ